MAFILLCAGCGGTKDHQEPQLTLVEIDGRHWKSLKAHRVTSGRDYLIELIPEAETAGAWSEMLTIERFSTVMARTGPLDPQAFAERFADRLRTRLQKVQCHIAAESARSSLVTWGPIQAWQSGDESGALRVQQGPGYLRVIQYTTKQPVTAQQLSSWSDLLNSSSLSAL